MTNKILQFSLCLVLIIIEASSFLYLDKYNYLHKGISIRQYEILPFYTKIQGDHNSSGIFTFTSKYINGLYLETSYVNGDYIYPTPSIIYRPQQDIADTVYLSWIMEYGYNEKDLVIKTMTTDTTILWLQPKWKNRVIKILQVDEEHIRKADFQWVNPTSGAASYAMLAWLMLLILMPMTIIYLIYLIGKAIDKED